MEMIILYESLVIIFMCTCFGGALFIFLNIKRRNIEIKTFYISMAFFALVFGIARIFYYIFDFILIGDPIIWNIAAIIDIASIIFLLFAVEKSAVPSTKFVFTILASILLVLLLIPFPAIIGEAFQTIITPIIAPIIPGIYIYLAYKTTGEPRRLAIIFLSASFIFIFANVFHSRIFTSFYFWYFIISPIFFIISMLMILYVINEQGKG